MSTIAKHTICKDSGPNSQGNGWKIPPRPAAKKTIITLTKVPTGFIATYQGEGAKEIVELFGVDSIPTGFTAQANPAEVLSKIQALNPLADCRLA